MRTCRFGVLEVSYDDRVLEPRPWTAAQSRWIAELSDASPAGPILELCAGAGQIGLLAAKLTGRDLVQIEADPVAAAYALRNAAAAGLSEHVDVRVGRMEDALHGNERFPMVSADPPYLPTAHVECWPDDPVRAIDGGPDGMGLVRSCLAVIGEHLDTAGVAVLQVWGPPQAAEVRRETAHTNALVVERVRTVDDERALVLLRRLARSTTAR